MAIRANHFRKFKNDTLPGKLHSSRARDPRLRRKRPKQTAAKVKVSGRNARYRQEQRTGCLSKFPIVGTGHA